MSLALVVSALLGAIVATILCKLHARRQGNSIKPLASEADRLRRELVEATRSILDTPLGDDVTVPRVQPITLDSRSRLRGIATAMSEIQDTALDLAVEQAVLRRNIADSFVNVGRRTQQQLGRLLDLLTELEHQETDPDALANLFRIDHLATKMRRNAESLLVLTGVVPAQRWTAPVRLSDVIRAALGEVEDYQRVSVRSLEQVMVLGYVAADLAHLCAELLENALVFTPPHEGVEIRGRSGADGYMLAIIDYGRGMPKNEIALANRRLAGAENFTVAPSKYLGHYVAGQLAARHDIKLSLHSGRGHGLTAIVAIPTQLTLPPDETAEPGNMEAVEADT